MSETGGPSVWHLGPVRVEVQHVPAPPAFSTPRTPPAPPAADASPLFVIDARAADVVRTVERWPDAPIACGADGDVVHAIRPHAFDASIDFAARTGSYCGLLDVGDDGRTAIFDSFLRVLASGALLRSGGALLHGAAVVARGQAYVFLGASGVGKTTLVDEAADARDPDAHDVRFLADDQVAVTSSPAGFSAWGSPFGGCFGRTAPPSAVPLGALVLLDIERQRDTVLDRVGSRAEAASSLLRHVCAFEHTPEEATRALTTAEALAASTPVWTLRRHRRTTLAAIVDQLAGAARGRVAA